MPPYPTITAETLLQDWEIFARPTPGGAYRTARAAMHAVLTALLPCLDEDADVNLATEDLRCLLHRTSTFQGGTATAHGPRRAEQLVDRMLARATYLGPVPDEPPRRGLLFIGSAPDAELEMDELTSSTEHLQKVLGAPELELVFSFNTLPALPSGTLRAALILVYGPLLPSAPLLPLPHPPLPDYSDPAAAFAAAAHLVVEKQYARPALLQRRLKLGHHRTLRLLEELEQAGIIGPDGPVGHPVLVPDEQALGVHLASRLR